MILGVNDPNANEAARAVEHHIADHALGMGGLTKLSLTSFIIGGLVFLAVRRAARGKSIVPKGLFENFFEGLVLFVRDELVRPAMGKHGDSLVPFFSSLLTVILFGNLMGLVPLDLVSHSIGGTITGNMGFTMVLAGCVLVVGVVKGVKDNGPGVLVHAFIPPGLPFVLRPVLWVLEFGGFLIRHLVLAVRLCINMTAGHFVIGGFFGIIFASGLSAAPAAIGLALFMYLLELMFCVIQAYVFTLLSVLFVGALVHPEH